MKHPYRDRSDAPAQGRRGTALLVAACALQACTSITVLSGDGHVSVERSVGFLNITAHPGNTPVVLHSTALGLQSGPNGTMLGYSRSSVTVLPQGCHLVLVMEPGAALTEEQKQTLLRQDLCVVSPSPQGER